MAARKKKTPIYEPKPMFHVGEIRHIKKAAEKFLLMLSEVGDIDGEKEDWMLEASDLCDEYVLKIGREMGLQSYEEIMNIMLMFVEAHNAGKKVGIGVDRKEYEMWKSHQAAIDEYDRSEFQRNHPIILRVAEIWKSVSDRVRKIIAFLDYHLLENQMR